MKRIIGGVIGPGSKIDLNIVKLQFSKMSWKIKEGTFIGVEQSDVNSTDDKLFYQAYNDNIIAVVQGNIFKLDKVSGIRTDIKFNSLEEMIPYAYKEIGNSCFKFIDGLFSAIVVNQNQVAIYRDPLGSNPIYYFHDNHCLLFSSDIKTILAILGSPPQLNLQLYIDSFVLSHPTGTETYFKGIYLLDPGAILQVTPNDEKVTIQIEKLTDLPFTNKSDIGFREAILNLDEKLSKAVQTLSNINKTTSIILSGGLDSSIITLYLPERRRREIKAFTVADNPSHPDIYQAGRLCANLNMKHQTVLIGLSQFLNALPKYIYHSEQTTRSIGGLMLFLLSEEINHQGYDLMISGEGADELFLGYPEFLNPQPLAEGIRGNWEYLNKYGLSLSDRASNIAENLIATNSPTFMDYIFRLTSTEKLYYLHIQPLLKCGAVFNLDIGLPYIYPDLFNFLISIHPEYSINRKLGIQKYILKVLALEQFGEAAYNSVLRQKMGFPSTMGKLRKDFNDLCNKIVTDKQLKQHELGLLFRNKKEYVLFELFASSFLGRCALDWDQFLFTASE